MALLLTAVLLAASFPARAADGLALEASDRAAWTAAAAASRRLAVRRELRWPLESKLPKDVPLERWNRMDPVLRFMAKHRRGRASFYEPVSLEDLKAGRVNVQVPVEVEGVVEETDFSHEDFDYCFRIGGVVMEMTPDWRWTHRKSKLPRPRVGQRVRVRGWTYYDGFHAGQNPQRETVWEIHPVQDVEILSAR